MDIAWMEVVKKMGHDPKIVPQMVLENEALYFNTDILIISNGMIGLTIHEISAILRLIESGISVYLQSEYLPNLTTNQAFASIVGSLGGSFKWKNRYGYDLGNVTILDPFNRVNNTVSELNYFWHSVSGEGDCNTINILEYNEEYHGFQYIPTDPSFGSIITIPDQDWILERINPLFMENIITHLINRPKISEDKIIELGNDTVLCVGEQLLLDVEKPQSSFHWQDGSIGSFFNVVQGGVYWIEANLPCGTIRDTITIAIEYCDCKIFVPDVFTPNRDNINDNFSVFSNCPFSEFNFSIFNRWGQLIFKSNNEFDSWDGYFRGSPLPDDVYVYSLSYRFLEGEPENLFGNVTLFR